MPADDAVPSTQTVRDLYDVAREVTDEVLGAGTYAELNRGNPDPGVQAAIARWRSEREMTETRYDFLSPDQPYYACEACGEPFDPVASRWLCPHCHWKANCCEGNAL